MSNNFKNNIYDFLTNPKVVRISTITAFFIVFSALIIGYIIAALYGPLGYNLIDNYISDMGSVKYTPFPYMRTISNLTASPLFMPITFYFKKQLTLNGAQIHTKGRLYEAKIGFIGMLVSFTGMIITGIFTEDISMPIHIIIAIIAFSGGCASTFFYGLLIIKYPTKIHRNTGYFMVFSIPIILVLIIIGFPSRIFYEWVFLLSFYLWIMISSIYLLK